MSIKCIIIHDFEMLVWRPLNNNACGRFIVLVCCVALLVRLVSADNNVNINIAQLVARTALDLQQIQFISDGLPSRELACQGEAKQQPINIRHLIIFQFSNRKPNTFNVVVHQQTRYYSAFVMTPLRIPCQTATNSHDGKLDSVFVLWSLCPTMYLFLSMCMFVCNKKKTNVRMWIVCSMCLRLDLDVFLFHFGCSVNYINQRRKGATNKVIAIFLS